MRLLVWSVNHRTAPLAVRERSALSGPAPDQMLQRLHADYPQVQMVILSTCNRTEVYVARLTHEPPGPAELTQLAAQWSGMTETEISGVSECRENDAATAHLFEVASGLDSMVLGEPQILGQVKRAYEAATQAGTVGAALHRLFQQAVAVARQVRQETGIDQGRRSVASVAAEFVAQGFDRFDDKTVVNVGAGEIAKVALRHLIDLKPGRLRLVNRTQARAQALAEQLGLRPPQCEIRPWESLEDCLVEADILLTSTAAPDPILTAVGYKALERKRRHRPLFIIDLGLPRDVEPAVGLAANVFLYNLDDLQKVVGRNAEERESKAAHGRTLVQQAAQDWVSGQRHQDVGRVVKELRTRLHELGDLERERTLRKLQALPPQELAQHAPDLLGEMAQRLVNKILHLPLSHLDRAKGERSTDHDLAALRRLFQLEANGPTPPEAPAATPATTGPAGTPDTGGHAPPVPASPSTPDAGPRRD